MKTSIVRLLLPILISALSISALAGNSGGGSYSVQATPGASPLEISLFLKNPKFQDTHNFVTPDGLLRPYYDVNIRQLPAFDLARKRLSVWRHNSPGIVQLIEQSFERIAYFYVESKELSLTNRFEVPQNFYKKYPNAVIKPIVIYDPTDNLHNYKATLSLPVWSQLGDYSQAAVIIKEALRVIQLDDRIDLKDINLQDIVGTIILGSPGKVSLDSAVYIHSKKILSNLAQAQALEKSKAGLQKDICSNLYPEIQKAQTEFLNYQSNVLAEETSFRNNFCSKLRLLLSQALTSQSGMQWAYTQNCNGDNPKPGSLILSSSRIELQNMAGSLGYDGVDRKVTPETIEGALFSLKEEVNKLAKNLWVFDAAALGASAYFDGLIRQSAYPSLYADSCNQNLDLSNESKIVNLALTTISHDINDPRFPSGFTGYLNGLQKKVLQVSDLQSNWNSILYFGESGRD